MTKIIKKISIFIFLLIAVMALAHFALALDVGMGYGEATGLGQEDPRIIVAKIIRIFLGFLGIIAVGLIVYAGWLYMTAEGEEDKIEKAKKILKSAVIGLIICLASFAIASFILSKLLEATGNGSGGGIGCDPPCVSGQSCCSGSCQDSPCSLPPPNPTDSFNINSTIPRNLTTNVVRNVVVKTFFNNTISDTVDQTVLDNNFKVERIATIASTTGIVTEISPAELIATTTSVREITNGRKIISFKNNDSCGDEKGTLNCFPEWSKFKITVNGFSGIISFNNQSLNCIGPNCQFVFSTSNLLDSGPPQAGIVPAQMCEDDGLLKTDANTVAAWGRDDVGISGINFYQKKTDGAEELKKEISISGQIQQKVEYKYDTKNMAVGDKYTFSALVYDMANTVASSSFTTVIKHGHCCNDVKDVDEADVDCGGNDCLSCFGGPCNKDEPNKCGELNSNCSDSLCSTWFCACQTDACKCGSKPIIFNIAPLGGFCSNDKNKFCQVDNDCGENNTCNIDTPNGASDNFVTISGRYFGATTNKVIFLGNPNNDSDDKIATFPDQINAQCANFWQNNQIIAVVPEGAVNGPIKVVDSANLWDTTDNNRGPAIKDFQINNIKRPGLCLVDPNIGGFGDSFTLQGASFDGADKKVLFGNETNNISADTVSGWTSTKVSAKIPNIQDGRNSVFVTVASTTSNSLNFTIKNNIENNPKIDYLNPTQGPKGQYVTIYGKNFKNFQSGISVVKFYLPADPSNLINADVDFPVQCQGRYWHDSYITVKVPTTDTGDYKVIVINKDNKTSNTADFKITTGSPSPGLCLLDPYNGPVGQPITAYGDYFGSNQDVNGRVVFYNNINSSSSDWTDQAIKTNVPAGAQTGPFKVIANNQKISNTLPFKVGVCSANTDCLNSDTEECCASGTYNAGLCKTKGECSLGGPKSCVFGWTFSTGRGPTTPLTCGGYSANSACSAVGMCPNSRGLCQTRTNIETGDCSNDECNAIASSTCLGQCIYDSDLNKCKLKDFTCDTATTTIVTDFTAECRKVNDKNIWQINTKGASCPIGTYLETNSWCSVGDLGNPTECSLCSSGFACQEGECIIPSSGCPTGSTCDIDGKCIKGYGIGKEDSICECCCRVANSAQDCCTGLTCKKGGCGSDEENYGLCTGCKVTIGGVVDQTLSDQACNCFGSSNRYCKLDDSNYPTGFCEDQLIHKCGDETINTGEQCDDGNLINNDGCDNQCKDENPIEFCSGHGLNQCNNSYFCPNSPGKCSSFGGNASSTPSCDCCCSISDNDATTGKNLSCCAPLTCDGRCGSSIGTTTPAIFGSCSGCAKAGSTQDEHNSACNCSGTTGKFCLVNTANSNGVCKDCAQITDPADCSGLGVDTCCVDAQNENVCRGGAGNKDIINNDSSDLAYCSYYSCNMASSTCSSVAVASSTLPSYRTLEECSEKCINSSINIPSFGLTCAKQATSTLTCDENICAGFSCLNEDGGNASTTDSMSSSKCGTCCCDPSLASTAQDKCRNLSPTLVCKANQTPCDGDNRGLCCGCANDNECGYGENGCSNDTCCRARPKVVDPTTPADNQTNVCRNTVIEAIFDQAMDISGLNNNMFLIGDYGADQCPVGTKFLADSSEKRSNNIFVRAIRKVLISLEKILKPIFSQNVLAIADHNYCLISGAVSGYNNTAGNGVIAFAPQKALDKELTYYVVIQGDASTTDSIKEGVLNNFGVSMEGDATETFNAKIFINSKIWSFKTSKDICELENVIIDPDSYLFQTSENNPDDDTATSISYDTIKDSDKVFHAKALATNGQEILPLLGVYSWEWNWSIDNNEVVKFKDSINTASRDQTLVAQNKKDEKTIVNAKATITDDKVANPSTVGKFKTGKANVYVLMCANPWPPVDDNNTWRPWQDASNNCKVGLGGTCFNNNFEFYYCRDAGQKGTADDLPAILKDTVIRGFSNDLNILKEYYFLREGIPSATTALLVEDQKTGGKVVASWIAVDGASGYKLYYGKASNKYDDSINVASSTSSTILSIVSGLTNGQTYYFAVTAYYEDTGAESGYSNEQSVTPTDTTAPIAPISLTASSTNQKVELTWPKATDDTAYYQAFYGTASGTYGDSVKVDLADSCSTTECKLIFENLTNGVDYYFAIKAFDRYNNGSEYSNEVSAKPE